MAIYFCFNDSKWLILTIFFWSIILMRQDKIKINLHKKRNKIFEKISLRIIENVYFNVWRFFHSCKVIVLLLSKWSDILISLECLCDWVILTLSVQLKRKVENSDWLSNVLRIAEVSDHQDDKKHFSDHCANYQNVTESQVTSLNSWMLGFSIRIPPVLELKQKFTSAWMINQIKSRGIENTTHRIVILM